MAEFVATHVTSVSLRSTTCNSESRLHACASAGAQVMLLLSSAAQNAKLYLSTGIPAKHASAIAPMPRSLQTETSAACTHIHVQRHTLRARCQVAADL